MYNKLLQNCFDVRLKRPKINEKEAGDGLFFYKKTVTKLLKQTWVLFSTKDGKGFKPFNGGLKIISV